MGNFVIALPLLGVLTAQKALLRIDTHCQAKIQGFIWTFWCLGVGGRFGIILNFL